MKSCIPGAFCEGGERELTSIVVVKAGERSAQIQKNHETQIFLGITIFCCKLSDDLMGFFSE
jgi:hypothetical protein